MKTVVRDKQWAEKYPELGTEPVPTEPYYSDEHYALERERIFKRTWINVGRVDDIPEPGDYFVRDLAICKVSVLIIRGSDGVVRGFHNVCSHRGNTLVLDGRGTCPGSVYCHFHNWVYSDTGELIRVPDEENFFELDKRDHGLTPVNTDIWEGFVFVHLDPEPAETLRGYLGGVAEQLDGCPFHEMRLMQTYKVEERANWKVALDAQNELYHLPFQHHLLVGDAFVKNDKGLIRFQDVNLYNYHSVWSCENNPARSLPPLESMLFAVDDRAPIIRIPQMIGEFDFFVVFPNFVLLLFEVGNSTSYISYNLWPLAVDRTIWEIRMHFRDPGSTRERLQQEYFKCIIRDALQEDAFAHENIHAGLASRAKSHVVLQDEEAPIRYFHKVLEDHCGFYRNA
ncbi:MAG: aromatic ring-hydroxylating dioxygenase subunit alpha [Rhodospirillales bacterium]|nr:aromatic ring-hydroxylating dioxygenase subunit alpha [Rhodospirillales bacterium]